MRTGTRACPNPSAPMSTNCTHFSCQGLKPILLYEYADVLTLPDANSAGYRKTQPEK
jgi:hypothetical protein